MKETSNLSIARQESELEPASNDASYEAIEAYIQQQMRRLNIPGLALAIVEGDRIVHFRGLGHARPGGEPATPQTPFCIGSLTKSITALAVMQLVEAGKVELDAPVQCYLPWFRVADPAASARMTVRHLLNQTSGLPMLQGTIVIADMDPTPGATERQARALSTLELTQPVGAAFDYCNYNYNLLGLIIEAASGESYADYIQSHIFSPLEMRHSYTSQAEAIKNGLALGHRYWFTHPVPSRNLPLAPASIASGQLISCAEDMSNYLIAHLNGGRYKDVQILSSKGIDELHRAGVEFSEMGESMGYAMGWFVTNAGPVKIISHGGNVPDFSGFMALVPEQNKGIVMLLNSDHYGLPFVLMEVGGRVAALLAGQPPAPIQLGLLPWIMRALLLIPLAQIAVSVTTLRQLRRWQRHPEQRPGRGRAWGQHMLLPLIPNLSLAALPLFLKRVGLLNYLKLYNPDIYWTALICGIFAGIWTLLRTGLILKVLRGR